MVLLLRLRKSATGTLKFHHLKISKTLKQNRSPNFETTPYHTLKRSRIAYRLTGSLISSEIDLRTYWGPSMSLFVASMESMGVIFFFVLYLSAAYPAVYGQFPQAIPQPMSAVAPAQREGKALIRHPISIISKKKRKPKKKISKKKIERSTLHLSPFRKSFTPSEDPPSWFNFRSCSKYVSRDAYIGKQLAKSVSLT